MRSRRYFHEEVFPWFFLFYASISRVGACSITWNRVLIRLKVRQHILWCINLPKIRNHCDVKTFANKWSKVPLPVDGVRARSSVKFGLVCNYVSCHDCFQKLLFNTDAVQNRQKGNDRQWDYPGIHRRRWSFVFSVFSEYQGCHTDGLSVSVYGVLIIYILTLAALNVWKTHILTWVLSKWNKTPIFTISRKMVNTCVIRMLFDSNNTWTNKFISSLCVLLSSWN